MRVAQCGTWLLLALFAVCLVCVYNPAAAEEMYRYIPVLNVVALEASDQGCMYISDQLCRDAGSYIPGDVSPVLHDTIARVAGAARSGTWYGFLGSDTTIDLTWTIRHNSSRPLPECTRGLGDQWVTVNEPSQVRRERLIDRGCIWRWRSGRWLDVQDLQYPSLRPELRPGTNLYLPDEKTGVAFFAGNDAPSNVAYTLDNAFPIYFKMSAENSSQGVTLTANNCGQETNCDLRPGRDHGRQLMAVGFGSAFTWSDGRVQGGYPYTQFVTNKMYIEMSTYSNQEDVATPWLSEIGFNDATTISQHLTVCMMYTPARHDKELYNTSSQLQSMWWLIFLVILFAVCLVIFLIALCCQEREDMDEPPEDAPEWADAEVRSAQRPKRVVSQRSFRQQNDDQYSEGDKYEELDQDSVINPLNGSQDYDCASWQ